MTEYEGWKNYETWATKLWIDNEQSTYEYWREQARDAWANAVDDRPNYSTRSQHARYVLASALKDAHQENVPEFPASVYTDLLNAALSDVDWFEIAGTMLADEQESGNISDYDPKD